MNASIESCIENKIKENKRGSFFFIQDFMSCGDNKACGKALERLVEKDFIMRVARGIYVYPKQSKLLGAITPSIEEIAMAIAKRDRVRIIPTGIYALNLLGLSTQIPMKMIYLTDGMQKRIMIGNRSLIFKRSAAKNFAAKGEISSLVIQALRYIGKDKLTAEEEDKIIRLLQKEQRANLIHDIVIAPNWIREIMKKALK